MTVVFGVDGGPAFPASGKSMDRWNLYQFSYSADPLVCACLRILLSLNFWGREWMTRQRRLEALV